VTRTSDSEPQQSGRQGRHEVFVEEAQQRSLAAARQRTTFDRISQEIRQLLNPVWSFLGQHPGLRTDGHNIAVYWDESGAGSIEVGVEVVRTFEPTDAVVNSATPAGLVATTAHFGPYSELGPAHDAVRSWCKAQGLLLAGPFWEIYGDWSDDPRTLRTDVCYLLEQRAGG
jgi:effector-binding domain-containing protein